MLGVLGFVLATISSILRVMSYACDRQDIISFKRRLEEYWFKIESIGVYVQAENLVLESRKWIWNNKYKIIMFYFLLVVLVSISSILSAHNLPKIRYAEGIAADAASMFHRLNQLIEQKSISNEDGNYYYRNESDQCVPYRNSSSDEQLMIMNRLNVAIIVNQISYRFRNIKDLNFELAFYYSIIITAMIGGFMFGMSLYLSLIVTIYLLGSFSASNASLLVIFLVDILLAAIMPLALSAVVIALFYASTIGFYELSYFWRAGLLVDNEFTIAWRVAIMTVYGYFWESILLVDYAYLMFTNQSAPNFLNYDLIYDWFYDYYQRILDSLRMIYSGNPMQIPSLQALLNWSLLLDVLISISYLLYVLSVLAISRSAFVKRTIANIVQKFSESETNKYSAIGAILGIVLIAIETIGK